MKAERRYGFWAAISRRRGSNILRFRRRPRRAAERRSIARRAIAIGDFPRRRANRDYHDSMPRRRLFAVLDAARELSTKQDYILVIFTCADYCAL